VGILILSSLHHSGLDMMVAEIRLGGLTRSGCTIGSDAIISRADLCGVAISFVGSLNLLLMWDVAYVSTG
jgi:hypothetical protein